MFGYIYEQWSLDPQFPFALFRTSEKQQFLHSHNCLELNMIAHGEGSYIINGKKYPIEPGDLFVINNKEPHMAVHKEELDIIVLVFDMDLLWKNKDICRFLSPFLSRKKQFSHRIANGVYDTEMADIFHKMNKEYESQEKGWQMALESLLMYLLTLLYRCYDEKQELEEELDDFQKMYARIYAVFNYIEKNFRKTITLDELASLISISPQYLCRCFKKVTGRTIFAYIEQMRVQYSCYLLRSTEDSITEIAFKSGFNSVSYYNRMFKKYEGRTPKNYRRGN